MLESSAPLGAAAAGPAAGGGRFDVLPISNGEVLRQARDGSLEGVRGSDGGGFLENLDRWWLELCIPAEESALPFTGGWFVYLSYEIAREIEPTLRLPASPDPISALAIRTPAAWIRDRRSGASFLVAEPGHEVLLERFEQDVARCTGPAADRRLAGFEVEEEDPHRFTDAVRRALEYIAAGDVYQANLSRGWHARAESPASPTALYRALRSANPSPFAALLRDGDFAVISSSPERLVSVRGGIVSTRPIAGTRPRGGSPQRDAELIESLLGNEKERAEHVMLIDLERNDLGRICVGGSVRVDEYMVVESYAHVHHIVSNVSGLKLESVSPVGTVRAMFPGGTITGCPKVRCMEIIAELEAGGRGAYTGSIGYINRDGSCDFNILIRTITANGRSLGFRAGAGIVADSKPAQELAETRAKAEGMLRALRPRQ